MQYPSPAQADAKTEIFTPAGSVALVGHPNVGKSALFQRLTGQRVMVSIYPGTTVEVTRGVCRGWQGCELIDTPGVIAFPPHSDDEQVTSRILFDEPISTILQVGDAKNLRRTLSLSVQLAEMGIPLVLALNMMDEVKARGMQVDPYNVARHLGAAASTGGGALMPQYGAHQRGRVPAVANQPFLQRSWFAERIVCQFEDARKLFVDSAEIDFFLLSFFGQRQSIALRPEDMHHQALQGGDDISNFGWNIV